MATRRALIDMLTAMHLRTLTAFKPSDDILPTRYGYPFRMRIPTKIGFRNSEVRYGYYVANQQPRGFWTHRG
jgi:DMSO/TMAO reductase YedYZ molybdopterin-dependent catalytic subunit